MFSFLRRARTLLPSTIADRADQERRLEEERTARARADLAQARAAFLADVSRVLADGSDPLLTLPTVARLAVPFIADACVIDLVAEDDRLVRAAVAHRDPSKVKLAEELLERYPPHRDGPHPLMQALRTRQSQLVPRIPDKLLEQVAQDARHLELARSLCLASAVIVPLVAHDRTLGALSLVSAESRRQFDEADLALGEDLARRIALAVESARLYREAADAHRRFHDLVQGLGAVVWEADAVRLHHTFVSERAAALFGHPVQRWLDQPDFWLAVQHPDDRERSATLSRTARAEGREHDLEYRVVAADGRLVWVLDLVRLVRHPDGRVHHLRGVMVDVTETKRTEQAVRDGEEARRQAMALTSVAALANAAAHEINNPLGVVTGNLELLARRPDLPAGVAARVDVMLAASRRIADIVASMRRITRVSTIEDPPELPTMLDFRRSSTSDPSG